jgi:flagellar basal body-associated protein FliL
MAAPPALSVTQEENRMEGGMIWVGIVVLLFAIAAGLVALAVSLRRKRQGG